MSKLTDNKLDRMLGEYFSAASGYSFTFDPKAPTEHTPVPTRRFRIIAAAAAVVLVSALSLTIYLIFGNITNAPIAFSPISQSSVTPAERGTDGSEAPTSLAVIGKNGNTEEPTGSTSAASPTSSVRGISPTSASERAAAQPTQTQNPSQAPTQIPTQNPTQKSTQSVTESMTAPTSAPTQKPTAAPTQAPTEAPTQKPTSASTQPPTEPISAEPEQSSDEDYFIGISIPRQAPGTELFCGIYDPNGSFMGDPDPYSAQHSAELITESDGVSYALYYPLKHGLTFETYGKYPYRIYDQNGNELASYYLYVI